MTRARAYRFGVAALIAGLVGFLAARELSRPAARVPSPQAAAQTATAAKTTSSRGSAGSTDGIRLTFARTPSGAAAAAVNYLNVLEQALIPGARWTWTQAIRALTTQPLEARALAGQTASDLIKAQLAHPGPSFMGSWPLGYRLVSFTRVRARVAIWTVGAMASPAGTVPATFSTTICRLVWTDGGWKVAGAEGTAGPTPPSVSATATDILGFVRAARAFTGFGDVP